jgi:hypothetical protein
VGSFCATAAKPTPNGPRKKQGKNEELRSSSLRCCTCCHARTDNPHDSYQDEVITHDADAGSSRASRAGSRHKCRSAHRLLEPLRAADRPAPVSPHLGAAPASDNDLCTLRSRVPRRFGRSPIAIRAGGSDRGVRRTAAFEEKRPVTHRHDPTGPVVTRCQACRLHDRRAAGSPRSAGAVAVRAAAAAATPEPTDNTGGAVAAIARAAAGAGVAGVAAVVAAVAAETARAAVGSGARCAASAGSAALAAGAALSAVVAV